MTPTLTRDESGPETCAKCSALPQGMYRRPTFPARWTLRTERGEWRLCASHAAAASHHFGIVDITFNPTGQRS